MQTKIFVSSVLAILLSVGAISADVGVEPRGLVDGGGLTGIVKSVPAVAAPIPPPTVIPIVSITGEALGISIPPGVKARDLVNIKQSSINWGRRKVTNFHNRRVLKRETPGAFW